MVDGCTGAKCNPDARTAKMEISDVTTMTY
jgi:hypothetical protein